MERRVRIAPQALDVIVGHARAESPRECCGVLLGKGSVVDQAIPTRNLSANSNRYLIDPQDHVNALRFARMHALELLGFFHSHPHSDAHPSATDVAEISYPGFLYVIVGLGTAPPEVRVFRAMPSGFEELIQSATE